MTIGIWTPVEASGGTVVFDGPLNSFASKLKSLPIPAGTHMKFANLSAYPVFIHAAVPANDEAGFTGTAVVSGESFVMPRLATIYVYSPYAKTTLHVSVGTLT